MALAILCAVPVTPGVAAAPDCVAGPDSAAGAAAPMRFSVERHGKLRIVRAEGEIVAGAAAELEASVKRGADEIWLDSPGGDIGEALLMGRVLRRHSTVTRVGSGARCAGACAEAFLGGTARFVDEGGKLGFTSVPLSDPGSAETQAQRETAAARWAEARADYYIRGGVSRGLLRLQLDVPAPGTCWLSQAGMRRFNVVNARAAWIGSGR